MTPRSYVVDHRDRWFVPRYGVTLPRMAIDRLTFRRNGIGVYRFTIQYREVFTIMSNFAATL